MLKIFIYVRSAIGSLVANGWQYKSRSKDLVPPFTIPSRVICILAYSEHVGEYRHACLTPKAWCTRGERTFWYIESKKRIIRFMTPALSWVCQFFVGEVVFQHFLFLALQQKADHFPHAQAISLRCMISKPVLPCYVPLLFYRLLLKQQIHIYCVAMCFSVFLH